MSRKCDLTGVGVQAGNNVSHSHRKTRRRFMPNLHKVSLLSEALGRKVSLRVTAHTLRSIDHNDGLDNYLTKMSSTKLAEKGRKLKKEVAKAKASA